MNPARPAPGTRLGSVSDLDETGARGFVFSDGEHRFSAFVVKAEDGPAGYIDRCPHAGWPLAFQPHDYLTREGDHIICAGHGALFRLKDGVCVAGPCAGRSLTPWRVTERDGDLLVA